MSSENIPLRLPEVSDPGVLRVIAIGSRPVVDNYVLTQYRLGYAEVQEWSRPLPTSNAGEVMRILTKRGSSEPG